MMPSTSSGLRAALYFAAFFGVQLVVTLLATLLPSDLISSSWLLVGIPLLSSLLTVVLFLSLRWATVSPHYIQTRPWAVFFWAAVLALGTVIPSEALNEALGAEMPKEMEDILMGIVSSPLGYFTIAIIVPLAEELVFRGAILRVLLPACPTGSPEGRWQGRLSCWLPIVFSALLFGLAHGNLAQLPHAFLLGLLLGWMYVRTGSIVPGYVVHLVNNTVAYLLLRLSPDNPDARLIDLLQGNHLQLLLYVGFSLLVFLPALCQLHLRMRR